MNVVIPYRNTCGSEELEMCIKLIKKNLDVPISAIYVIGDLFDFNDNLLYNKKVEEQKYNKWLDSNFLIEYYIKNYSNNEPFILFNDDFFITSKIDSIGQYYCKTIEDRILTTNIIDTKTNSIRLSMYGLNLQAFLKHFDNFENYETHTPMLIEKPEVMLEAIRISKLYDCPALKRTLYMYLLKAKGQELKYDVKFGEPLKIMQYPFFSLTDRVEFLAFEKELAEIAK